MERIYTIPLRKKTVKTAKYKRSPKSIKVIKEFLMKHMKSENVKLSKELNEKIWARGIKNPPGKVKVKAVKDETGKVTATLEE
jgi:large subunit ribosomal protein L31e